MSNGSLSDDAPQVIRINTGETLSLTDDSKVELWISGNYAPAWFRNAKEQAALDEDKDDMAKPREILFAVCAIESYLVEWVRDEVLNRNYQRLKHYFPVDKKYVGIVERWKQVITHLFEDGTIRAKPNFGQQYWTDFDKLVQFRNGLVHGRASRPDSDSIPENEKPGPTNTELVLMAQGWAVAVVAEVIRNLHAAAGTAPPQWLSS